MSDHSASSVEHEKDYVEEKPQDAVVQNSPVHIEEARGISAVRQRTSDYFTILASGAALISDGYQNNLMTAGNAVFKQLYPKYYDSEVSTRVSNALLVGAIIGQITVGLICDRIGRKTAIVATTLMIVLGATLATASSPTSNLHGMFWMLTVARGITGVGVGGEYPASSTSASEAANEKFGKNRGPAFIMVTNFVLSIGGPIVLSLFLIILSGLHYGGTKDAQDLHRLSVAWRVLFGLGIALPLSVFYFRIKMLNSKLYRRNAIKRKVPYVLMFKRYWKTLLGTAGTWFLYDFVTFPNGIFSSTIIASVIPGAGLKKVMEWTLLLSFLGIPGVIAGACVINYTGRKWLLIMGFSGYLIIGLIVGCAYEQITKIVPLFIVLYGLMQSMGNFGPGNCEGTISAESYPSSVRGTMYGISAAVGKAGAAIGTQAFTPIQIHLGKRYTFIVAACCGVVGMALAFFFVEDKTNDDLAKEDEEFRRYLVANGWNGWMGDGSEGVKEAKDLEDDASLEFAR